MGGCCEPLSSHSGGRTSRLTDARSSPLNMEIRKAEGQPIAERKRQKAIAEALRRISRMPGIPDRKKGVRSYQSHIKSDPWVLVLFVICFVLPSFAGAIYYGLIASDRFVTEARFAVRPNIGTADKATPDAVGTNAGVPKEMIIQDTLVTQEYIHSRPMLEAIEAQMPLREYFGRDSIDYISRFNSSKTTEKFLRYWKRHVDIDVDPGTGILTLYVEAFDPDESLAITQAVLSEAERMINSLSAKPRQDAVEQSALELKRVEERVLNARQAVNDQRNREGVVDAQKANEANIKMVSELRGSRINLAVQLAIGQRDLGPESRRMIDIRQQIKDLDDNIARLERQSASQDPEQKRLLSNALTRYEALEHDRKREEKYYEQVRIASERARIVAAQKVETFATIIPAVKAESSVEPRRYLMTSLIAAGAAILFAAAVFTRKVLMN